MLLGSSQLQYYVKDNAGAGKQSHHLVGSLSILTPKRVSATAIPLSLPCHPIFGLHVRICEMVVSPRLQL